MEVARKLEIAIGSRWHGISFINDENDVWPDVKLKRVSRFCEAVRSAVTHKMVVRPGDFACPGAAYAFGGMVDLKETMIDKMIALKGYSKDAALQFYEKTPHLQVMPKMIAFDCKDEPDVLLSLLQPEQAMRLLQRYHIKLGRIFSSEMPSIISACGNTVVKAFLTNDMAISFGCDDSRTFGKLSRDRLYVGLPYSIATQIVSDHAG